MPKSLKDLDEKDTRSLLVNLCNLIKNLIPDDADFVMFIDGGPEDYVLKVTGTMTLPQVLVVCSRFVADNIVRDTREKIDD